MDKVALVALFEELENLLAQKANAAHVEDLEKYFQPEIKLPEKQNYYYYLASSLQNGTSSGMDRSIRFNAENKEAICEVLCQCDFEKVLAEYHDYEELYKEFAKKIPDGGAESRDKRADKEKDEKKKDAIRNRRTNWEKYARGLYEGACFLRDNGGIIENLLEYNHKNELDMPAIKKQLSSIKIPGLGTALRCDWLKECGCTWLAKPDVHIKTVYQALVEKEEDRTLQYEKIDDFDVIAYYFDWAKTLREHGKDVTVYKLDKIIWLICTGDFYLDKNSKIGRNTILAAIGK